MIPTVLKNIISDERRFNETWRYTNVADLAALPAASQPAPVEHSIEQDTTMPLVVDGAFPSIIFRVAAGVTFNLMARMSAPADRDISLFKAHIHLAEGARMNHVRITDYTPSHNAFLHTTIDVAAGADYQFFTVTNGARRCRQELVLNLNGENARAALTAAYVLRGATHHDLTAHVNHNAPHTHSNQFVKGMAADTARGAFQGKIAVAQAAQHTEAYQLHKAMLLGERAEIDAKPELEIFADQVKCSHGNAVGALDENALFFLRARGLNETEARQMLMHAFIMETLDAAPDFARDALAERLGALL